jgi:hypothetical protein
MNHDIIKEFLYKRHQKTDGSEIIILSVKEEGQSLIVRFYYKPCKGGGGQLNDFRFIKINKNDLREFSLDKLI